MLAKDLPTLAKDPPTFIVVSVATLEKDPHIYLIVSVAPLAKDILFFKLCRLPL